MMVSLTTGIVAVFMPHILLILISKSLYFDSFSVTLTEVLRSDDMAMSMSMHSFFVLFLLTMSGLLALISVGREWACPIEWWLKVPMHI